MSHKKYQLFIILLFIIPLSFSLSPNLAQIEVIEPSTPTDVYIEESATYDAPIGDSRPIMHLTGILYWERLAGIELHFYINTTDIIVSSFWDHETGAPIEQNDQCSYLAPGCLDQLDDRFRIVPEGRSFEYTIDAHYDPDIIQDTGFIVIFNSQLI